MYADKDYILSLRHEIHEYPEKGCVTLPHNNDFLIDEDAFPLGTDTCVQFVLDNMGGIDMEKVTASDERME